MSKKSSHTTDPVQIYLKDHPWTCAGFSLLAGLICGLLLAPRKIPASADAQD